MIGPETGRRLLAFKTDSRGRTLSLRELRESLGSRFAGVNLYFGVNRAAVDRVGMGAGVLLPSHAAVLDDLLEDGAAGRIRCCSVGLWPYEAVDPFGFLIKHLSLVASFAGALHEYQERARQAGNELRLYVRYASEMNDPAKSGHPWGRTQPVDPEQAEKFRRSYGEVRRIFADRCPGARFVWSPALRRDNAGERYRLIADYWPGDPLVDVIGCTWCCGRTADFPAAAELLLRYHGEWKGRAPLHGVDEMGGVDSSGSAPPMLASMLRWLDLLPGEDIELNYLSLFLNGRWGNGIDKTNLPRLLGNCGHV